MTTSIDPSIDELLLLQENHNQLSNFIIANIKPIGAERKNGQPLNMSTQSISQTKSSILSSQRVVYPMNIDFLSRDIQEKNNYLNSFETIPSTSVNLSHKLSTMSIDNHNDFSLIEEPIIQQTNNELKSLIYQPFYNYSSSSASSTSDSSTTHSPRSHSHLLDNYNYQQQILSSSLFTQQKLNQSILIRTQTAKTIPSFHVPQTYLTNRFFNPHSSQLYSRNPFVNISQQTQSFSPMFTTPFQCTRERFQVNSIGRPIFRTNNYNHLSQIHHFKVRR